MSREIDERVVQMKFEKGQFEKDIQTSIHNLDELKKGLDFKDASKGFEDLDRAARGVDLGAFGNAVDAVRVKFSMLDVLALDVMHRISNAMIDGANAAKRFVTSLTIDQVAPGWSKYAEKTTAVQTIMAATAAQFSNTAEQMAVVNSQLEKLNWFTDETSYTFTDMVSNIGKFTSNNIALDQSVTAMQGIANWAAISGQNANAASRAMYNLSQALGLGAVTVKDWMSIENANMATAAFKEVAIEAGLAAGTLVKAGDKIVTATKKTEVSVQTFRETLQEKWFSSDVLILALDKYGAATNAINEMYEALGRSITTSSIISGIDDYIDALERARSEATKMGLEGEAANNLILESTTKVASEVSEEWGISLEDALEWLQKFDDESMQFGLTALKAAQEAKTFQEAIDSVKEAVSTGWMKTFELIFGDYLNAKELWTDLANALYDIFAAGGEARNEMLKEWSETGGRRYFTETIYASLAAILSILNPIKAAWYAVFGEMNSDKLIGITRKLYLFVKSLIQTDEQMAKIARTFRGLFSIVDMFRTIIGQLISGTFKVLNRFLDTFNLDLGEVAATIGDILYLISLLIKQTSIIDLAFDAIGDGLAWIIAKANELINTLWNFGPAQAIVEAFTTLFTGDFKGIGGILESFGNVVNWIWQQILAFRFPTSLNDILQFFKDFGIIIKENFDNIGLNFSGFSKLIDSFKSNIASALGVTVDVFTGAFGLISAAILYVYNLLKTVDWEGVIIVAFGAATLAILWKFASALYGVANALKTVTDVGISAKGAFDAIKGYFSALKANIKTNNILKVAASIVALAGAFYLLGQLRWYEVIEAGIAMGIIGGAVAALAYLFSKFKLGEGASGFSQTIMSFAVSIVMFAYAVKMLPSDPRDMENRIVSLIGLLTAITVLQGALMLLNKFTKSSIVAVNGLVSFAGAILVLVLAVKLIGQQDLAMLYSALPVILVLMAVLAYCSKLLNTAQKQSVIMDGIKVKSKTGGAFGTAIAVIISMLGLIYVVKQLGKMDLGQATKGLVLALAIIGELSLVFLAARLAGKYASQAGKMILFLGAGLSVLISTIKKLADMDQEDLKKGGDALKDMVLYIIAPLIAISKLSGQYAAKAGLMILEIAGALAIIQLVVKTLGKVDTAELIKGVSAVSVVILTLGLAISGMNRTIKTSEKDIKTMTQMTIIVGVLSGLIFLLTLIDPLGALVSCVGISAVLTSLAISFNLMNGVKLPDTGKIATIMGFITAISIVITVLSVLTDDWKKALTACIGLSLVIVAISSVAQILKNSATSPAMMQKLLYLGLFATAMAIVVGTLASFTRDIDTTHILGVVTSVSELAIAMGICGKLIGKLSLPSSREFTGLMAFAIAMGGIVIALGYLVGLANEKDWDISNLIFAATSISELTIAMSAAVRIMGNANIPPNATKQILAMGGIMTALGLAFAGSSYIIANVDPVRMIAFSTSMSIALIAMAEAIKIMNKVKIGDEAIGQIITLGAVMAAVSVVFSITSLIANYTDIPHLITFAGSVSVLILALAAAMKIMNKVEIKASVGQLAIMALWVAAVGGILLLISKFLPEFDIARMITFTLSLSTLLVALGAAITLMGLAKFPDPETAAVSVIASIVFLGAVAALMAVIAKFAEDASGFETAAEVLHQIGLGIGGLVGGLIEGFVKTAIAGSFVALCEAVGQGVAALVEGFKSLSDLPGGALGFFADLTALVAAMAAAEFISGLKTLPVIGPLMAKGAILLIGDFMAFGKALKAFAREIKGIDAEAVEHAANAVAILAKTEGDMYSIGHIIASLLGVDNFDKFGERLQHLGQAIVAFALEVKEIPAGALDSAVNAAQILVALEQGLGIDPGSWIGKLLGLDSLESFGQRCNQLGTGLRNFVEKTENVTEDKVQTAVNAAKLIVKLESELQPINGLASILFGNQSIGQFGKNVTDFGEGLADFAYSVRNLSYAAVENGTKAGKLLVELQNEIEGSGGVKGFWFGKTDLGTFSGNLNIFGQSMVDFSTRLENVNFTRLKKLIDYIREFMNLEDFANIQTDIDNAVHTLMANIIDAIEKQQTSIKIRSANIIKWIGEGMSIGTNTYGYIATNAAIKLANEFVLAFEKAMGIASPSLVMNEEGHWVVKGLAEGISEDTSAEDAIKQKAQNIVSAFDSEIQKLGTRATTLDLEKQLWQLTDGKVTDNMSESQKKSIEDELLQREIAIDSQKLADLAKTVGLRQAELDAIAEVSGVGSEEYEKAYQTLIQARIDMETLRQQMEETYNSTSTTATNSWADTTKAIADWQKDYAEAYEMLGKSKEELRRDAYKAVTGITDDQYAKMQQYNEIMAMTDEEITLLGKSRDELDEYAKSLSGWTGLYAQTAQTMVDTNKIITENIEAGAVDMAASIEQAEADAIKEATKKGGGASSAAAAGGASLGEDLANAMSETLGGESENIFTHFISNMKETMEGQLDNWTDIGEFAGKIFGEKTVESAKEKITTLFPGLTNVLKTNTNQTTTEVAQTITTNTQTIKTSVEGAMTVGVNQPVKNSMTQMKTDMQTAGEDAVDGLIAGLQSQKRIRQLQTVSLTLGKTVSNATRQSLQERSPSRVAMEIGEYFTEGLSIGITNKLNAVTEAGMEAGNTASNSLSYAAQAIDNILSSDENFQPVITPVLDFESLKKQAAQIPDILSKQSGINVKSITARVGQIAASNPTPSVNSNSQNGNKTGNTGAVNYNFTQNNYSPTALSRTEIYRQTNNQFSRFKEATKT